MARPYLNEPVALVLLQELGQALLTAQALAENAEALQEQIPAITAHTLHLQLVEIERCIGRALGFTADDP